MFRRLLVGLLVLLIALVVVADRVGALVAGHVLASKVQTDEHFSQRPDAHVGGIPFLTQAIDGKYTDVTITAHHLTVNAVPVTTLVAHLHGVHISASAAISGNVHRVPVDRADGTVTISYADINHYLSKRLLHVGYDGNGRLRVGLAGVATVAVDVNLSVVDNDVRVALGDASAKLPTTIHFRLYGLPFRIELASVTATSTGIVGTGTATHLVLGS